MNLRDLRYLVALADDRHFGRRPSLLREPADALRPDPKLEEYLGVALVERQPRRVGLTETGEQVVQRARRLLRRPMTSSESPGGPRPDGRAAAARR